MELFHRLAMERKIDEAGLTRLAFHADGKQWDRAVKKMKKPAADKSPADVMANNLKHLMGGG